MWQKTGRLSALAMWTLQVSAHSQNAKRQTSTKSTLTGVWRRLLCFVFFYFDNRQEKLSYVISPTFHCRHRGLCQHYHSDICTDSHPPRSLLDCILHSCTHSNLKMTNSVLFMSFVAIFHYIHVISTILFRQGTIMIKAISYNHYTNFNSHIITKQCPRTLCQILDLY